MARSRVIGASSSLAEALRAAARHAGEAPAILGPGTPISFATLDGWSESLAATLAAHGVRRGDRIALYCPNCAEFAVSYCGIVKAGGVVVPINLLLNPEEIIYIVNDAGATGLIFNPALVDSADRVRAAAPSLQWAISTGEARGNELEWSDALMPRAPVPAIEFDVEQDLAAILYTSGTTGWPKGAMLSHRNLLANVSAVVEAMDWCPGRDVVLVVLPMFHAFAATVGMLTPLLAGCALVPVPRFDPDPVAQVIAATGATIFLGVPSMFTMLLRLRDERVPLLKSLRFCVSGGAALPVEVLLQFERKFGVKVYEGDGPTECSPVTCVNPIGGLAKPGTVGLPVPGVEMKIVDEGGQELEVDEVGEIAVRGANVFRGYWKQPEATAECFLGDWFLTGDLGSKDHDGYFSIVDRKKDLIIVNGMNVYPRVIEEVLHRHTSVREAAVVGQPHRLHGEIPVAFVVLHPGHTSSEGDIKDWCKAHLGRHEVPRVVYLIEELPRNAAGKVLKRQLRRHGEVERGVVPPLEGA